MPTTIRSTASYRGAFAASLVFLFMLIAGSADSKVTFTTFPVGIVTGVNSVDTVTGYNATEGFVRTADGTITTFEIPAGSNPEPWSINDEDASTGRYFDSSGNAHAFLRAADGSITTFDVRGASITEAYAINNSSEVAGRYDDQLGNSHGFVRAATGRIRTFDGPDAIHTRALSINDKGAIAGYYIDAATLHGFIRIPDGTINTIDVAGSSATEAMAINSKGTVTGSYFDGNGEHGFMRTSDGTFTTFDYPGCFIEPFDINRHDVITGVCQESDNPNHFFGFLRRPDGRILLFHVPGGSASTIATGINDSGVIAGYYKLGGFLRFP